MISNTTYSLMIYFLICTREEIEHTFFFFFSDRIPQKARTTLDSYLFTDRNFLGINKFFLRIYIRIARFWHWPFLKSAEIFGADFLYFVPSLIGRRGITVIEDGTANYNRGSFKWRPKSKIKAFIYGSRACELKYGASPLDKKVILTGIAPIPEELQDKAEIIDIKALWAAKSPEFKEWMLSIFEIDLSSLEHMKGRGTLILTTSFDKNIVPEELAVEIFRNMVKDVEPKDIVIKPHPVDKIHWESYFPDAYIFRGKVPMEILTMIGVEFTDAHTIMSTAVYSLPKSTRIHFTGTVVHPLVERAVGYHIEPSAFYQR